ncbi:hypothetical protein L933_00295 [Helicobacter pylori PZ5056]|uniref:Uncharacterized protein n=1 Tax=Helicobacter pylori PZ5056 TaxID=1337393 RepID=T2SQB1_HELPX|nr:hypothetical protein L933_00295 [Helicobacter pylori PZ5056]
MFLGFCLFFQKENFLNVFCGCLVVFVSVFL